MNELELELLNLFLPVLSLVTFVVISVFFMHEWRSGREREFRIRQEELQLKREESASTNINIKNEASNTEGDLGGYIILDIPEERKSMFQDILKGFEEYSSLKGYKVSISIDSSEIDKISFKITILDFGVTANRTSVKEDLNEYINRIQEGDIECDLPEIINPLDHARILMALKNRITFLQQNYEVEKNIKEFYQGFVERLPLNGFSHGNPVFHISNGGNTEMDQRKYIAKNSANVMQGDNQNNLIDSGNITIGSTVNEKNEQVAKLTELIQELSKSTNDDEHQKVIRHCESIKDELLDEASPNEQMISKWLSKVSGILSTVEKGTVLFEKAQSVFEAFGV